MSLALERYFDNAATTRPDPRVVREMSPFFEHHWGNAHSIHQLGREASHAVESARQRVATLLQAEASEQIVFTSGATEANNWVLRSFPSDSAVSPFEHSSVLEPAKEMEMQVLRNVGPKLEQPDRHLGLISIMAVNNETGTLFPLPLSMPAEEVHSDVTQAAGKLPLALVGISYASLSAHKFYGPKGVGALYSRSNPPDPWIRGGEQEMGYRGGTLNVPAIVGFGAAAAIATDEQPSNFELATRLRAVVIEELSKCSDWRINGGDSVSPYILSISFLGIEGESLVVELDQQGFAVSSGAACSSRSTEPSHVLTALGVEPDWLRGTLRISFSKWNTVESARDLGYALVRSAERLRNLRTF